MTSPFLNVPQTGRRPITLAAEHEKRLLERRANGDFTDPWATDPNPQVRRLGRLAVRRDVEDPSDYFAVGDLCAGAALNQDRLLIVYIGKAIQAYRRAAQIARVASSQNPSEGTQLARDIHLADEAIAAFVRWVVDVARKAPSARNLAVGLWALTEISVEEQSEADRELGIDLAKRYITLSVTGNIADTAERRTVVTAIPVELLAPAEPPDASGDTQTQITDTSDGDLDAPPAANQSGDAPTLSATLEPGNSALPLRPATPLLGNLGNLGNFGAAPTPATPERSSGDFHIGDQISGRYEVREVLRGGMGIIYLCFDHETKQSVAIKTFQGRHLDNERTKARFTHEAHTWIRLEKHPHIVQARKVETFGDERVRARPHIIMEFVSGPEGLGTDLKSWIEHNQISIERAVEFGLHICLGMLHAVQKVPGLVHRDLKPANILVRHDGIAKVTDFGLVRAADSAFDTQEVRLIEEDDDSADSHRLTRAGTVVGTAPYMSPEQCQGLDVDLRSDIYAFGAILYEMLTGHRIFNARTNMEWIEAHLTKAPAFPSAIEDNLPPALRYLTLGCLAKNPADRPQSWEMVRDKLARIAEELTGSRPITEVGGADMELLDLMDQAYSLTELGFGQEALSAYDRALELAPATSSAWVWARKGRTLRVLNRHEEALEAHDRALELDPDFQWAWREKGIVLERLDEFDQARAAYQKAVDLKPEDLWAHYYQAGLLMHGGYVADSLPLLDKALQIDPRNAPSHARRGEALRLTDRHSEAAVAFDRALALNAKLYEAWMGKGKVLYALGQYDDGVAAFMQATRLRGNDIGSWKWLADALVKAKRPAEALPAIQQAARIKPQFKGLWVRLGLIYRELGRHAEAVEAYDRALALQPDFAPAWIAKGEALEAQGRRQDALACYRQGVGLVPDRPLYLYRLADLLMATRHYAEARTTFQHLTQLDPNSPFAWSRLGRACARAGAVTEALDALSEALRLNEQYAWGWHEKGLILRDNRRFAEALPCFERAAEIDPGRAWYWRHLADTLVTLRRYDDALSAYDRAIALEPGEAQAWDRRGFALERLHRFEDAIESYEKAIEAAPMLIWPRLNLIGPLLAEGRRAEALEVSEEAVALVMAGDPQGALPWARKGQILRQLNRHDEAILAYERALNLDPGYARAWCEKGMAYAALGRRAEALAAYEKATAIDDAQSWYWFYQGEALIELGRYDEAIRVLNRALELDPRHNKAKLKRDEARRKLNDK